MASEQIGNHLTALLWLALVLAVGGCETPLPREHVVNEIEEIVGLSAASQPSVSLPTAVADALLPSLALDAVSTPNVSDSQRYDISVEGAPAAQFFMSLVEGTPYNIVVHPEIQDELTLSLSDVTIPEIMEAVRDVYGFEFVRTGYGFQVLPGRLQARIYQINFLNVLRSGESSSFVSSGTLLTGGSSANTNDADTDTGENSTGATTTGTRISTVQPETAFWGELAFSIETLLGGAEGRSVVVNPGSDVVVVRALPRELREVETFLIATQLIVQRQVILEAKILEVELSETFQTGINWGALLEVGSGSVGIGQTGGGTTLGTEGSVSDINGQAGNLDPGAFDPIAGALASAFGGVFSVAINSGNFNTFIELLQLQGNVQVLSSPRIATLNNQKALIKVGTDEFFVTDVSNTTTVGTTTNTSNPSVELTPFFSGIALDVTPQISESGIVTLHIHPSVSQVVDQEKTIEIAGFTQTLPLALSTVRESDSIVRAQNGQVVVVGGLMLDSLDDDHAKPPLLGDIPGLGELFRHNRRRSLKSELVILLRPIVVQDQGEWVDALRVSGDSFNRLKQHLRQRETVNDKTWWGQ